MSTQRGALIGIFLTKRRRLLKVFEGKRLGGSRRAPRSLPLGVFRTEGDPEKAVVIGRADQAGQRVRLG